MELTILVFLPAVAAPVILLLPQSMEHNAKWVALAASLAILALSVQMFFAFDLNADGYQYVERHEWVDIGQFNLQYFLGVDGLSMPLVVLTTVLTVASVLVSFSITMRPRAYYACLMVLASSVLGVFVALDFLLFFLFWELELFPMFLLIAVWGSGRKEYSATKFLLYTIAGSAFMLVGILVLAFSANTFDIEVLGQTEFGDTLMPLGWVFAFLFIGFAVKLPIVPLHTWLPDAHSDAPTAVSVMLAGVLLKMGGYGFIRVSLPMFPDASLYFAPLVYALSVIAIIYTSLVALMQEDIKKLIAYSSVAHMGFVTMGLFSMNEQGIQGAMFTMISHGLVSGALFLSVGVIYDRMHTREIKAYGGLVNRMPLYAAVFLILTMANVALPGTSGFIGEFLTLMGAFRSNTWVAFFAASGVILSAAYALWLYRRVVYGKLDKPALQGITDLNRREIITFAPLILLIIYYGVQPGPILDAFAAPTDALMNSVQAALATVKTAAVAAH